MTSSPGRRDVLRNSAYFFGAAGVAFGALGGMFSVLAILAWLAPAFAETAPDWVFGLVVVLMLVVVICGWPALDILANRHPRAGGGVMAGLGMALIGLGMVAALQTPWGMAGWFTVLGGGLLLPAGCLALAGGGTEPLTWGSLRTSGVRATEARLNPIVETVSDVASIISLVAVGVSGLVSLVLFVYGAVDGRIWLTLGTVGGIGLLVVIGRVLANRRR